MWNDLHWWHSYKFEAAQLNQNPSTFILVNGSFKELESQRDKTRIMGSVGFAINELMERA